MISRALITGLVLSVATLVASQDPHAAVEIAPAKTSIYIGSVTMTMPTFKHTGASYESSYVARVFPYFFYNERGTLSIDFTDEQLTRLDRGERVDFQGQARNESGEPRRIEGHATPTDATNGKIKVRIFVTAKIELIFNTTYRFKSLARP
ncbi:MAG: hypothetical protein WCG63_10615 [Opitutaceae bacterium]